MRVLIAIPEKKGDITLPIANVDLAWPYMDFTQNTRVEQEAVFFDDILACIAAQYSINEQCISTVGVSAGALWASQLIQRRADRLASAIIISGGIGPTGGFGGFADLRGWSGSPRALPILYGYGGPTDRCGGIEFSRASQNLGDRLDTNANFVIECVHNCGHAAPPVDPAVGIPVLYRFALEHPYWLPAGRSPWQETSLPAGTPDWCSIGVGSATPRTGACPNEQTCPF
jgi:pimeloyl-ACP methyl ester carboxylesterase